MTIVQVKNKIRLMKNKYDYQKSKITHFSVGALAVLSVLVMSLMYTCCEPCWSHVG